MEQPEDLARTSVPEKLNVCRHLGLDGDRLSHCMEPSPEHRCYLRNQRDRVDFWIQERFFLTESHGQ